MFQTLNSRPPIQGYSVRKSDLQVMNLLYTGIDAVLDDVATLRDYRTGSRM